MNKHRLIISVVLYFLALELSYADRIDIASLQQRRDAINAVLDSLESAGSINSYEAPPIIVSPKKGQGQSSVKSQLNPQKKQQPALIDKVKVSGELRASVGVDSDGEVILRRANPDLNERNYRMLSSDALNRRLNTYDPAIYSQVKVNVDAAITQAVSTHMNVTIDPWSYTGKTKRVIINGVGGDSAKVRYLTVGGTGYTLGANIFTLDNGDGFSLSETKIKKGHVPAGTVNSAFGNIFDLPELKVDYTFMPIREFWVDLKPTDAFHLRVFPMAYENQALTSDDPLKLSNNKQYWEESPWLRDWSAGHINTTDFMKGRWDRSFSFNSKDSGGQHLTALRGASFDLKPTDQTTIEGVIATPKTIWQEYGEVTAVPASIRAKHFVDDQMYVGATAAAHQGFTDNKTDAENYVGSIDTGIMPFDGLKLSIQGAHSTSHYDKQTADYASKKQGGAYLVSIENTSNAAADMLNKDYFGIQPAQKDDDFYKTKVFWARMDEKFESSLSNYHETRDDAFWSRHLSFYPSTMRYLSGLKISMGEDDVTPFAIGNGIDYGRTVLGWRGDVFLLDGQLRGLGDIRHVSNNKGDHIETVFRNEWDYKITPRWTTKSLLVWDELPKTKAGFDPFIVSGDTGKPLANAAVVGDEDPSLFTGALGSRYQMTDWSAINGVWEHTNDSTLATDNFPRGVLNSSSFALYQENGRTYRQVYPFLYSQGHFDQAPYEYFNIFKTGLELSPNEVWHFYLDYTRNSNQFAGNIDDNMNHFGLEGAFTPTKKFGIFARYSFSQWNDLDHLVFNNDSDYEGYHNIFLEARLIPSKDSTVILNYGVGPAYNIQTSSVDPKLGLYSATVLETQHIFRLIYERKF